MDAERSDARTKQPEIDLRDFGVALERDCEGIWLAGAKEVVSFPEEGHANCLQLEDGSLWFRHRNHCIVAAAQRHLTGLTGPIFDVGGGNGFVAQGLQSAGFEVVLIEPGIHGARNARRRGLAHVICGTTEASGLAKGTLPAIGLFDVVEHIEDDVAFLKSMGSLLVAGGKLLLTVPAYPLLWSGEDVSAGHFRRHTKKTIADALSLAGLELTFVSYFFRPLPIPIFLLRTLPFRLGFDRGPDGVKKAAREHALRTGTLSRWLDSAFSEEIRILTRGDAMRFGGSLIAVARSRAQVLL